MSDSSTQEYKIEVAFGARGDDLDRNDWLRDTEETWNALARTTLESRADESLKSVVSRALGSWAPNVPEWLWGWLDTGGLKAHPLHFFSGDGRHLVGRTLGPLVDDTGRILWDVFDPELVTVEMVYRSAEAGILDGSPERLYVAGRPVAGGPEAVWEAVIQVWTIGSHLALYISAAFGTGQAAVYMKRLAARLRRGEEAAKRLEDRTTPFPVITLMRSREWNPEHIGDLMGLTPAEAEGLMEAVGGRTGTGDANLESFLEALTDAALTSYLDASPDEQNLRRVLDVAFRDLAAGKPPPVVSYLPIADEATVESECDEPRTSRGESAQGRRGLHRRVVASFRLVWAWVSVRLRRSRKP